MIDRDEYNMKIYELLGDFLISHPEIRFIQALWNIGIVNDEDRFYEEPDVTLRKVKENLTNN